MPKFRVFEVQERVQYERYFYDVEAESAAQAVAKVRDAQQGEHEPTGDGCFGEPDYGGSGFHALPSDSPIAFEDERAAYRKAAGELHGGQS